MPVQSPFQAAFAVRPLTAAATPDSKAGSGSKQQQRAADKDGKNALTVDEEEINAITDQIPQRPMGVVEGTSYTVIIIAGIAMAGLHSWPCLSSTRIASVLERAQAGVHADDGCAAAASQTYLGQRKAESVVSDGGCMHSEMFSHVRADEDGQHVPVVQWRCSGLWSMSC